MAIQLRQLERRLNRVSKRLADYVVGVQRDVVVAIGDRIVRATPVDTGFARGNWVPAINRQPSLPVTLLDKQAVLAPARIANAARALRIGDTFYISNNAPYIALLNSGYSPQAAAGFVRENVAAGVSAGIAIARARRL